MVFIVYMVNIGKLYSELLVRNRCDALYLFESVYPRKISENSIISNK